MTNIAEKLLSRKAYKIVERVEDCLISDHNVKWFKPSQEDVIRLLKLGQWEEMYTIQIETQLKILVPVWRKKFSKFSRHKGGLGVTIATLVGKKSEEILKDWLATHPYNGFEKAAKNEQQRNQLFWMSLQAQKQELESADVWEHPAKALREYKERMAKQREAQGRWQDTLAEKPYRGNPFRQ